MFILLSICLKIFKTIACNKLNKFYLISFLLIDLLLIIKYRKNKIKRVG